MPEQPWIKEFWRLKLSSLLFFFPFNSVLTQAKYSHTLLSKMVNCFTGKSLIPRKGNSTVRDRRLGDAHSKSVATGQASGTYSGVLAGLASLNPYGAAPMARVSTAASDKKSVSGLSASANAKVESRIAERARRVKTKLAEGKKCELPFQIFSPLLGVSFLQEQYFVVVLYHLLLVLLIAPILLSSPHRRPLNYHYLVASTLSTWAHLLDLITST